jgi:hypothetical protein
VIERLVVAKSGAQAPPLPDASFLIAHLATSPQIDKRQNSLHHYRSKP